MLVANAIDRGNEDSVGDGVRALHGLPGGVLGFAKLGLFARVPPNRGWVEERLCAGESREPCCLGIPLVPADQGADGAVAGGDGLEAEIAWSEIKLLVVERVVGNMHLAIDAGDVVWRGGFVVENGGGVVVEPGRAAFEEARDQRYLLFADDGRQARGAGARDGLCEGEEGVVFALAKVLGAE